MYGTLEQWFDEQEDARASLAMSQPYYQHYLKEGWATLYRRVLLQRFLRPSFRHRPWNTLVQSHNVVDDAREE